MSVFTKDLSLINLLEVGTQRGNKKSRRNPRLSQRIYGISNSLSLIDLSETKKSIEDNCNLFYKLGQKKQQIIVVGTSPQSQNMVLEITEAFEGNKMPYINKRWPGGLLTNWFTIKETLKRLAKLNNIIGNEEFFNNLPRKERLLIRKRKAKIEGVFGGLTKLKNNKPGAVLVIDGDNPVAIKEAELNKIPVVYLANTASKVLPKDLSHTIVCNNNSLKAVRQIIFDYLIKAYNKGLTDGVEQAVESTPKKSYPDKKPKTSSQTKA